MTIRRNKTMKITVENNNYVVQFPYDPLLVNLIKQNIPASGRSWDNARKAWIIAASEKGRAERAFGMSFPDIGNVKQIASVHLLTVHYLGQCKERAPGEVSAMALLNNGNWGAIFSEDVLRRWFEDDTSAKDNNNASLYAILGAKQNDDQNAIKTAYRRMAKQWHPDVCREPNANEMFLRIREAFDILSNPRSRGRYDAGLTFAASVDDNRSGRVIDKGAYRSPLRCGYILCEGIEQLGRVVVSKIISWDDIIDSAGRSMVSSWQLGDNSPTIIWS
jgi:hypothetical protein